MKKVFNSLCIFLAALFISCGNLNSPVVNNPAENKPEYNVKVSMVKGGSGTARTVTSASGVDLASLDWTIDFFDETSAEKIGTAVASKDGYVFSVEPGSYVAKASADYVDSEKITHKYYGESKVELKGDEEAAVVVQILVGLKKTAEGKGNIKSIDVDLSNVVLASGDVLTANIKSAASKTASSIPLTVTLSDDKKSAVLSCADSLVSGYYYLQIIHNGDREIPVSDYLVEISDGENVTGKIVAFDSGKNRIYYATTGEGADGGNGGGLSETDRIKYDVLMAQLKKENQWETVDIFMTEDPVIDLADFRDDRKYKFSVGKTEKSIIVFEIMNGQLTTTAATTVANEETALHIKDSAIKISSEEDPFTTLYLYDGASVQFVDSQTTAIKVIFDVDSDYVKTPFAAGSEGLTFKLDGETADKYAVIYAEGKYALVKTGTGTISIGAAIPDFELTVTYTENGESIPVTNQIPYTNGSVTFTATPLSGDMDDFAEDTVFEWKINDFVIESATSATFEFNPTTTPAFMNYGGNNVVRCYASNEGEMQSAVYEFELISHFFVDPGIMLWNSNSSEGGTVYKTNKEMYSYDSSAEPSSQNGYWISGMQSFENIVEDCYINSSFLPNTVKVNNFCFNTENGDVYILVKEGYSSNPYNLYEYSSASKSIVGSCELNPLSTSSARFEDNNVSMAYLNKKVYVLSGSNILECDPLTGKYSNIEFSGGNPKSITSDGKNLYVAYWKYEDEYKVTVLTVSQIDVKNENAILKTCELISGAKDEINNTYSYTVDLSSYGLTSAADFESAAFKFTINDMQIIGDKIYALLAEMRTGKVCRGGLIKLSIGETAITWDNVSASDKILGWYEPASDANNDIYKNPLLDKGDALTDIFYGPQKFIAIKPDVLWIADEGLYTDGSGTHKSLNRVVKVNLNEMSMTSSNVNCTLGWDIESCQFNKY